MKSKAILIATSNPGKLRDFIAAAAEYGIQVEPIPGFASLPSVIEDGATFEANARKKAEYHSRLVPGEIVLADDSGLAVDALQGAPGVRSARYAAVNKDENSDDTANNDLLLRELVQEADERRKAQFVCSIAAARDAATLATFRGESKGVILRAPRGSGGFGYDPLFYVPELGNTFAELSIEEKARVSHRGKAFRKFLEWYATLGPDSPNVPR